MGTKKQIYFEEILQRWLIFVNFLYFVMIKSMIEKETLQPLDKHQVVNNKQE